MPVPSRGPLAADFRGRHRSGGQHELVEEVLGVDAHACVALAKELSNLRRLLRPDTTNLHQGRLFGRDDTLDRAKLTHQLIRQGRADPGETLQQVQFPRGKAFRFSIVALQDARRRLRQLSRKEPQDSHGVFGIARVKYWQPPHHGQGNQRTLQRMGMNVGHVSRLRTLEQHHRAMWTSRKGRCLREEPSIRQRGREVRIGLAFDDDPAADEIVADGEMHHLDVEVIGRSREIEYRSMSFREINEKLMPWTYHSRVRPLFGQFAVVVLVRHLPSVSSWRGKPKVHGRVRQSTSHNMPQRFRA
jgi:hypothetical protein